MADQKFSGTSQITGIAVIKTLGQLVAATNVKVILREISVSFNGVSNTAVPIDMMLLRQTTAGTMTALTLRKFDEDIAAVIQTTAQEDSTGAEPTSGDQLERWFVHPQSGIVVPFYFDKEVKIIGGNRLALKIFTAPASIGANWYMAAEE